MAKQIVMLIDDKKPITQFERNFYRIGLWPKKGSGIYYKIYGIFIFLTFYVTYATAAGIGAVVNKNFVEKIFLTMGTLSGCCLMMKIVHFYRKKESIQEIFAYMNDVDSRNEYESSNDTISKFLKLKTLMFRIIYGVVFLQLLVPFMMKENILVIKIWVPLDYQQNDTIFWIINIYTLICVGLYANAIELSVIVWYLMLNYTLKYKILQNRLINLGNVKGGRHFKSDLIDIIKSHLNIHLQITSFVRCFNSLYTFQIATSTTLLCSGAFVLAFITASTPFDYLFYLMAVSYLVFEVFLIMYLGNEITWHSNYLSTCLFQSNWIDQSISNRKHVIILMELFKKPQRIFVGYLIKFPLELSTFTSILNTSYGLFNVLRNA